MYSLHDLGWNEAWESTFQLYKDKGYIPARISKEMKNSYSVIMESGEANARLSDLLWKAAKNRSMLPAIGDWVALQQKHIGDPYQIMEVLPRKSCFSRKAKNTFGRNFTKPGSSDEQVLSANVDIVFLVIALDADYKLGKIERYLSLINESGAKTVLILNKADICGDYEDKVEEAKAHYPQVPVHAISAIDEWGIAAILSYLKTGITISLIGSSGVGKSTLINAIVGAELLAVGEIRRADSRGRHTTAVREMVILSQGGVLIDNPGLRDIKIFGSEENLEDIFRDIVNLEKQCRFSDCHHDTEPGCAVKAAIQKGEIDAERLESYQTLKKELAQVNKRREQRKKHEDILIYKEKRRGYNIPQPY
ncbi:MAG: ribosome small subunit-dependent GTPase A [Candidatus Cloacimonetes bacterium]|nr:ribosome small subunit-dependent GTPase A [Candidatus Cloacimonadota bacterium]